MAVAFPLDEFAAPLGSAAVRVLVVLPTYQEADNIAEVLRRVRAAVPAADVLVVDDSSPDGTADIAKAAARGAGRHRRPRPARARTGLGQAYRAGFRWGLDRGYDVLVEMDSDLSARPRGAAVAAAGASRRGPTWPSAPATSPAGRSRSWSRHRRALSRWGNRYAALRAGPARARRHVGVPGLPGDALAGIDLDDVRPTATGSRSRWPTGSRAPAARIVEVPIEFVDRERGTSKMSVAHHRRGPAVGDLVGRASTAWPAHCGPAGNRHAGHAAGTLRAVPPDEPRTILHVDMDAFFAAVEVLDDPSLAGKPVIVGGTGDRGVVASCSYEARAYGVRSAMPSTRARRLCPHAVFLPGDYDLYAEYSQRLHAVLTSFTPLVEGIALDEAFLDVTGARRLFGRRRRRSPPPSARRSRDDLGLWCVGRRRHRASSWPSWRRRRPSPAASPGGRGRRAAASWWSPPGEELAFLHPLPVQALWGVGPATRRRLERFGVRTVGDLAALPEATLVGALGGPRPPPARPGLGTRRPAGRARTEPASRSATRRPSPATITTPTTSHREVVRHGRRGGHPAPRGRIGRPHGHPQGALRRLPHDHPVAHACPGRWTRAPRIARVAGGAPGRRRPSPGRAAARRERVQPGRRRRRPAVASTSARAPAGTTSTGRSTRSAGGSATTPWARDRAGRRAGCASSARATSSGARAYVARS